MAILFSKATLASGGNSTTFLIAGAPSTVEEFDGWTAYHSFIDALPAGTEVQAHITAYTLHRSCRWIGQASALEELKEKVLYACKSFIGEIQR